MNNVSYIKNDIKLLDYKDINEKVYEKTLLNGLKVVIFPKPGFNKYFASFACEFGGNDNEFLDRSTKEVVSIPNGVAHFLEHKMFEIPTCNDVTLKFSEMGVDANAFTEYNQTCYIISGYKMFNEALELLLDYVQTPYFTTESVNREKGIIIQEYKSYVDEPYEKINLNLMRNMYEHSYTKDIVGEIKDIKSINRDILYKAYNAFYHPCNMILTIAGDIDPLKTFELIEKNQQNKKFDENYVDSHISKDENKIIKSKKTIKIDSLVPMVGLGIRFDANMPTPALAYESIKIKILLDLLIGINSNAYQEMLDLELITSISNGIKVEDRKYSYIKIDAVTNKPNEYVKYIKKLIKNLKDFKISNEDFNMIKKANLGLMLQEMNDLANIALTYVEDYFLNVNMFDIIDYIKALKLEDIEEVKKYFLCENLSVVIGKDTLK